MTAPHRTLVSEFMRRYGAYAFGTMVMIITIPLVVWLVERVSAAGVVERREAGQAIADVVELQRSHERLAQIQSNMAARLDETARVLDKVSARLERLVDTMTPMPSVHPSH